MKCTNTKAWLSDLLHIPPAWPSAHRTPPRQNSWALRDPSHWGTQNCCSSGGNSDRMRKRDDETHTSEWETCSMCAFADLWGRGHEGGDVGLAIGDVHYYQTIRHYGKSSLTIVILISSPAWPPAHTNTHITEKLWILSLVIPKNDCKLLRSTGSINLPRTITLPLQCLDKCVLKYSCSLSPNTMFLIYARKVHVSLRSHSSAAHSSNSCSCNTWEWDSNALLEKNREWSFWKESLFCPWQCLQTG